MEASASKKWDLNSQTPHGGQEWREISNFYDDFSVTTNPFGPPISAQKICLEDIYNKISHYPSSDYEPTKSNLAYFLTKKNTKYTSKNENCTTNFQNLSNHANLNKNNFNFNNQTINNNNNNNNNDISLTIQNDIKDRLLLGNGASELIDLCIRSVNGKTWRPGPFEIQYMEYQRSALSNNFITVCKNDNTADLLCMVNPCNPTGEFMHIEDIKQLINNCKNNSTVIIDESMIVFYGDDWLSESLVSQYDWIKNIAKTKNILVYVLHSWTKIWSCPGLRIGSLLAPTFEHAQNLRCKQVPWSMNSIALSFLSEVVKDDIYLKNSWKNIIIYKNELIEKLITIKPNWKFLGESWLPFIWININNINEAKFYYNICKSYGVPIRWGGHGYNMPKHIRIGVKIIEKCQLLFDALNVPFTIESQ